MASTFVPLVCLAAVLPLLPCAWAQNAINGSQSSWNTTSSPLGAVDGNGNPLPSYSPARPPAIPLAVRSPYTSAWSTTAGNATLNSASPIFWPGNALGWEGMVAVDGVTYEYLGIGAQELAAQAQVRSAVPQTVRYDSQYSNFTFRAGPVAITANFFSPVTPRDVCRSSIPLSYLTTSVQSLDGRAHRVHFYSDIDGAWLAPQDNPTLTWDLHQTTTPAANASAGASLASWIYQLDQPYLFGEQGDFAQWGNVTYTSSAMDAEAFSFESGFAATVRSRFVSDQGLADAVDADFRGAASRQPVFAFAHDAGVVTSAHVRYTVGAVQTPLVRYLNSGGLASLQPWWARCYGGDDVLALIAFHWHDWDAVTQLGAVFETALRDDVAAYYKANPAFVSGNQSSSVPFDEEEDAGTSGVDQDGQAYHFDPSSGYGYLAANNNATGLAIPDVSEAEAYYSIVALSARQVMGAYVYAIPPTATAGDDSTPLMFQKEISSDGNVNTVDVLYPATPFFLWANPDMLKWTLEALFQNQQGGFYPNGYSMHDLGSHFPNATGHVEGNDEYMPVEESGNMILMAYAYYRFSSSNGNGDVAWVQQHYALLKQWALYLVEFALVPSAQLSTDDFAGTLANQTNLALKGIVGLQAMSALAGVAGAGADADGFTQTAREYYDVWTTLAVDPAGRHALLAYEWRSSWGLLYNVFFDKLLGLGIVADDVYDRQSAWYAQVSQVFGVPLDNRHHYTKSDWSLWTAATCAPATRRLFVNSVAYWLNHTSTGGPFSDLYETVADGSYPEVPNWIVFQARPVVGGHFSLLAMHRAGELMAASSNGSTSVS